MPIVAGEKSYAGTCTGSRQGILIHLDMHKKQWTIKSMLKLVAFEADAYDMSTKPRFSHYKLISPLCCLEENQIAGYSPRILARSGQSAKDAFFSTACLISSERGRNLGLSCLEDILPATEVCHTYRSAGRDSEKQ